MRTFRRFFAGALLLAAAALAVPAMPSFHRTVQAQGYSLAAPNVRATAATGLGLTYTNGTVVSGGLQTSITGNTLTATDAQTSCAAPAYSSCNFVYWTSGASLAITTSLATATVPGNVIVAYVTTASGNINVVTPASWNSVTPSGSTSTVTDRYQTITPVCAFTPTTTAAAAGFPKSEFITAGQTTVSSFQTDTTAGTVEVTCTFTLPNSRSTAGTGLTLTSVDVNYNIVTTTLTTFANPTFSSVTGPSTAGGAGTGTVLTTAGGSLTFTPSSIQKTAQTTGLMYRLNIALGTPVAINTVNASYTVDFILTTAGSTATKIQIFPFVLYTKGS